jgi:hypothetical protein
MSTSSNSTQSNVKKTKTKSRKVKKKSKNALAADEFDWRAHLATDQQVDESTFQAMDTLLANIDELKPFDDDERKWLNDSTLYRFVNANEGDVEAATKMLIGALEWRRSVKPHKLTPSSSPELASNDKLGTLWINGFDRSGQTIVYIKPGGTNPNSVEVRVQYLAMQIEAAVQMLQPPAMRLCWICDFSDYGSRGRSPGGLAVARQSLDILQNKYPERLGRLFVINTPWMFSMLFTMILPFLSTKTKNKISWLKGDEAEIRKQLADAIDDDVIDSKLFSKAQ